jgi:tetrahydromethanopterin S-methyltransferase subunit G
MKSSSLMVTTQTNFEERDNMLRESSIAEDYWKHIIEEIKRLEAKMIEEQNEKINSSVIDSIRDKIGNKILIIFNTLVSLNLF